MAFNMSSATYARSQSGIASLKADLQGDITAIQNCFKTSCAEYSSLVNTIKANWVGEDADAYIKSLNTRLENLSKEVNNYKACIDRALSNDLSDFRKFQNTTSQNLKNL